MLLWPLRPAQVCWSSAARKAASSVTSCLLRALRWPLPPARLPPHLALPQPVAESESAPTAQLRPGVVRGCLCGKFLCRWGSKARAPSVSLRLWRWLPAGPTARGSTGAACSPRATRAPLLLRSLGSARASTGGSLLWQQLVAGATLWSWRPCGRKAFGLCLGLCCCQASSLAA